MASLLTSFIHQQDIWSWLQLKPRTSGPGGRYDLGPVSVIDLSEEAAKQPTSLWTLSHARARAKNRDTGPQEVTALSLEMGCVFFRALALSSWLAVADWAVLLHYTHWKYSWIDVHVHPGRRGRREGGDRSCDTTRACTERHASKHVVPNVPRWRELPPLRLFRSREGKGERVTISSCYDCYWLTTITVGNTHNRSTTARLMMPAWLFSSCSPRCRLFKGLIRSSNPWKKSSF